MRSLVLVLTAAVAVSACDNPSIEFVARRDLANQLSIELTQRGRVVVVDGDDFTKEREFETTTPAFRIYGDEVVRLAISVIEDGRTVGGGDVSFAVDDDQWSVKFVVAPADPFCRGCAGVAKLPLKGRISSDDRYSLWVFWSPL